MDALFKMFGNSHTTLAGLAGGLLIYLTGIGGKLPETRQEWGTFVLGLVIAILGVVAKDATTGSAPPGILLALLLSGCSAVNGSFTQPLLPVVKATVEQGLINASWNLDQAIIVGALGPHDPAATCLHDILGYLGLEPGSTLLPSFTPRVSDLISEGSVLYIRAKQSQRLAGVGVAVPEGCKALLGQFVIDAGQAGKNLLPGGGLLPVVR